MDPEHDDNKLGRELSPKNALQSDFEETDSMDSDERYLVRSHTTLRHSDQP